MNRVALAFPFLKSAGFMSPRTDLYKEGPRDCQRKEVEQKKKNNRRKRKRNAARQRQVPKTIEETYDRVDE